jgi:CheY-like chemotaxis protein
LVDGAEGLAYVRSESGGNSPPPDLVVLDLNLPKNDGAEVLQAMRAAPSFARIPVAVLSSSSSLRERARIEQFGVTRYITKPSDLDDFLKIGFTLRDILAQRHTSRSTGE